MDKIIVISNMFDKEQSIAVYKNNLLITTISTPIDEMVDTVKGLLSQYSLSSVDLVGNKDFLEKYKNAFNTDFNHINVSIVSK